MTRKLNCRLVIVLIAGLLLPCLSAAGDPNLIAHWAFDEGTGTTAYDSIAGNHGILVGNPTWTTGQIDDALSFDGVDDYIELSSTVQFDDTNFSITGWFRTGSDTTGTYEQIWNSGYNGGNHDLEVALKNNNLGFGGRDSSGSLLPDMTVEDVNDNSWHHFAALRSGNDFELYFDGSLSSSGSKSLGDLDAAGVVPRIGNGLNSIANRFFNGSIDDVRVYDGALSAEKIELLYWAGFSSSERAIMAIQDALDDKLQALERVDTALESESLAYQALEELLATGDYGDLDKRDIAAAQREIESAIRRQHRLRKVLLESIESLEDSLSLLGGY